MSFSARNAKIECPDWLPRAAENYLEHTVLGRPIRKMARSQDCHPSTILRQVRRLETKRDDPLIDSALTSISTTFAKRKTDEQREVSEMSLDIVPESAANVAGLPKEKLDQDGLIVLRRLCERGAVLAVARDMESAVVVREDAEGHSVRTAVVERDIAEAIALRDWIKCDDPNKRINRYYITAEGLRAVQELTAEEENRAHVLAQDGLTVSKSHRSHEPAKIRSTVTESPIMGLARRKDKFGEPFLSKSQVSAGERLRQDFEISQLDADDVQECLARLSNDKPASHRGIRSARQRLHAALTDLGSGLSEVAMECCCFLNGIESTENKMGWSARSGKIVLRIALTRLEIYYNQIEGKHGPLIG